jgi:Uma2 family endonuclease
MATVTEPTEQRLHLYEVPWEGYLSYSDGLGPRHIRVTYDRGEMDVMTLSSRHEWEKKLLARLVEALTEEMGIDIAGRGSMTCRRPDLERALEPDEAYWIDHEAAVREVEQINLEIDPPPDLVLEIEISRSAMNRMAIYAAMRVPEVWRWDGEVLRVCLLTSRRIYRESDWSKAFPFLPLVEFTRFLKRRGISDTKLLGSFRAWVRKRKKHGWKESK